MVLATLPSNRVGAYADNPAAASLSQNVLKNEFSPHHACSTSTPGASAEAAGAQYASTFEPFTVNETSCPGMIPSLVILNGQSLHLQDRTFILNCQIKIARFNKKSLLK